MNYCKDCRHIRFAKDDRFLDRIRSLFGLPGIYKLRFAKCAASLNGHVGGSLRLKAAEFVVGAQQEMDYCSTMRLSRSGDCELFEAKTWRPGLLTGSRSQ